MTTYACTYSFSTIGLVPMLGTCTCSFALVRSFAAFVLANNAFNNYYFLTLFEFFTNCILQRTKQEHQEENTKIKAREIGGEHQKESKKSKRRTLGSEQ